MPANKSLPCRKLRQPTRAPGVSIQLLKAMLQPKTASATDHYQKGGLLTLDATPNRNQQQGAPTLPARRSRPCQVGIGHFDDHQLRQPNQFGLENRMLGGNYFNAPLQFQKGL